MTKLETLYRDITKEQKRIEMVRSAYITGVLCSEFRNEEINTATAKIKKLQKQFDEECEYQNK